MSDSGELIKRYLEQREELGEGPVVVEGMVKREKQKGRVAEGQGREEREGEEAPPPTGITIQPPSTDLFTEDSGEVWQDLDQIATAVKNCEKCRLCETRKHTVPGEGSGDARVAVVGEGPGAREDETGRPFVGRAGELLTDILKAIDLEREAVYICNIVKCRPPSNRTPRQEEIDACVP